jgi:hypothetical protein
MIALTVAVDATQQTINYTQIGLYSAGAAILILLILHFTR